MGWGGGRGCGGSCWVALLWGLLPERGVLGYALFVEMKEGVFVFPAFVDFLSAAVRRYSRRVFLQTQNTCKQFNIEL